MFSGAGRRAPGPEPEQPRLVELGWERVTQRNPVPPSRLAFNLFLAPVAEEATEREGATASIASPPARSRPSRAGTLAVRCCFVTRKCVLWIYWLEQATMILRLIQARLY